MFSSTMHIHSPSFYRPRYARRISANHHPFRCQRIHNLPRMSTGIKQFLLLYEIPISVDKVKMRRKKSFIELNIGKGSTKKRKNIKNTYTQEKKNFRYKKKQKES